MTSGGSVLFARAILAPKMAASQDADNDGASESAAEANFKAGFHDRLGAGEIHKDQSVGETEPHEEENGEHRNRDANEAKGELVGLGHGSYARTRKPVEAACS